MSNTPGDQQSLLRDPGYLPESSPTPGSPTLRPANPRRGYQRMDSSGHNYNDPAPGYSSPVSVISNFETFEAGTAGLGIIQRPESIQRVPVGSRNSSSNPFKSSSSALGSPNLLEDVSNRNSRSQSANEGDARRSKNIFSESPEVPFVTVNEVPRGTPSTMNNESDNDNDNLSMADVQRAEVVLTIVRTFCGTLHTIYGGMPSETRHTLTSR